MAHVLFTVILGVPGPYAKARTANKLHRFRGLGVWGFGFSNRVLGCRAGLERRDFVKSGCGEVNTAGLREASEDKILIVGVTRLCKRPD